MNKYIWAMTFYSLNSFAQSKISDSTPTTIDCEAKYLTSLEKKGFVSKKDNMKLTFSNLKDKRPLLVGNAGSVPLAKFENGKSVYLIETTDGGNINVFTFYDNFAKFTLSKQYQFFSGTDPVFIGLYGECKPR